MQDQTIRERENMRDQTIVGERKTEEEELRRQQEEKREKEEEKLPRREAGEAEESLRLCTEEERNRTIIDGCKKRVENCINTD